MIQENADAGNIRDEPPSRSYQWVLPAASACAALLAGVVLVTAAYMINQGAELRNLLALGYPGVSVIMFFSSATVLLPAPGFAAVLAAGGVGQFNPVLLGIFAALGSSFGELTGYLVGMGGRQALHASSSRWVRRCEYFMRRWGFLTILVMASFPNPAFDAVGVIAGSLGYSPRRLWVACLMGNLIKYTGLALLGGSAAGLFKFE